MSVRDAEEAQLVSRYPIGILDVKEPKHGALGAADSATLTEISRTVGADLAKSFSAGELSDWSGLISQADQSSLQVRYGRALPGYRYVKIGLAGMRRQADWRWQWQTLFAALPDQTNAVAVAYLDHRNCDAPPPTEIMELARVQPGCSTILFDTFHKTGDLFSHIAKSDLARIVSATKRWGLTVVVAGSVDLDCLADVLEMEPDFIGVRGAVCRGGRAEKIDGQLVSELLTALQAPVKVQDDEFEFFL